MSRKNNWTLLRRSSAVAMVSLALLSATAALPSARADDGIFPPAPAAKASIDFDGKGFLIRGERTFIASGSIHYPRVPRALWRDRLLRLKRAGFNTVETYAFWNYHEPTEGKFDFRDEKDLGYFLKLTKELGLYAIVRVGPYVCAEWDGGGYPAWLRFKPGLRVREDEPQYIKAVDRWYEAVLPIIAKNQIHRGGAVVMVQLENEHPKGWGREMPNGYFRHLLDKAHTEGLEVPLFFSGLHHGNDPAGNKPWESANRTNPWFTTEFWPGWYDIYGALSPDMLRRVDRGTWKILAFGGNGYNFYMLHGGTNFDTWAGHECAASYDYGAAIGQTGDLRPVYYRFKRANLFAQSFPAILEDSDNATTALQGEVSGEGIRIYGRQGKAGTLLFLDNPGANPTIATLKGSNLAVPLHPGEIAPVVRNVQIVPNLWLYEAAHVLGVARHGKTVTIVVYGPAGSKTEVRLAPGKPENPVVYTMPFPGAEATEPMAAPEVNMSGYKVRVLALNEAQADRTWFTEAAGGTWVVVGPEYLEDFSVQNGKIRLTAERTATSSQPMVGMAYGPDSAAHRLEAAKATPPVVVTEIALTNWSARSGISEAAPTFPDKSWLLAPSPRPMGADGDPGTFAWYRTTITVPSVGNYELQAAPARDRVRLFLNGAPLPATPRGEGLTLPLTAGENHLAIFAARDGRDKLFNHLGPIDTVDVKGIAGPAVMHAEPSQTTALTQWRWRLVDNKDKPEEIAVSDATDAAWKDTDARSDVFNGRRGFAVYRLDLGAAPAGAEREIRFANVDDNATIYLNGKKIGTHQGWGQPFAVSLKANEVSTTNVLTVIVENTDGGGGIMGPVTLRSYPPGAGGREITTWKMQGGLGDVDAGIAWQTLVATAPASGVPTFYRTDFTLPTLDPGNRTVRRVSVIGLSRGYVWLNGHNLGRYPDRVMPLGLYAPECWLKPGKNRLVVFDEEGASPGQVQLVVEQPASRSVETLTER